LQGGPHVNQIAGIAVAMKEADSPAFRRYAKQIVKNAKTLAAGLQKYGFRLVSGGTDTHLMLLDTMARGVSGKDASTRLEKAGIIANMNTIPHDPRSPMDPSGLRLGTPAVTTRGMKEKDMKKIARKISEVLLK
jgi:glycine hydroxymethyltransferase